jgi:hypothetical protein
MAEITNRLGLPAPILKAAKNDSYSRGGANISITELIGSPRIRILRKKHHTEITEDASDRFWAIIGSALHHVMETNAEDHHISEERLFATVEGWVISGGIDLQMPIQTPSGPAMSLADYKMTTAWAVMNEKMDWERQLNCYAYLVETNKGIPVESVSIIAIIRDWSRRQAATQPDYPQSPMVVIPQKLWSREERDAYIYARVREHQAADRAEDWGEDLVECNAEERWTKPPKYAVIKPGNKRAMKVFDADQLIEAEKLAEEKKAVVEHRPGEETRCEMFCSVSEWCEQFKRLKSRNENDE